MEGALISVQLWQVQRGERKYVVAMDTTKKKKVVRGGNIWLNSFRNMFGFVWKLQLPAWESIDKSFSSSHLPTRSVGLWDLGGSAGNALIGKRFRPPPVWMSVYSPLLDYGLIFRLPHILPGGIQLTPPHSLPPAHPVLPPLAPVLNLTLRGAENN